ncbi:N-acetyldiaminopimelate deacetylase, partial [Bacillus thuringiensis]|nr:N-acetyldiaminopimelate deacetylase [Bacillus thuringiensis]
MQFVHKHTDMNVIKCNEAMAGEDFGYMIREIAGFMFWLGVNSEYGLHHAKLKPDEEVIEKAITFLSQYVKWKGNRK